MRWIKFGNWLDKGEVKVDFKLKDNIFMIKDLGGVGVWEYVKVGDFDFGWMILLIIVNVMEI